MFSSGLSSENIGNSFTVSANSASHEPTVRRLPSKDLSEEGRDAFKPFRDERSVVLPSYPAFSCVY